MLAKNPAVAMHAERSNITIITPDSNLSNG